MKCKTIDADVVIFGGGITGLTAAHELAERNFRVVVVDPDYVGERPLYPKVYQENPGLGGVARSQWGFLGNQTNELEKQQLGFPIDGPLHSVLPPRGTESIFVTYRLTGTGIEIDPPRDLNSCRRRGQNDSLSVVELHLALEPLLEAAKDARANLVPVWSTRPATADELELIRAAFSGAVSHSELTEDQQEALKRFFPSNLDAYNAVKKTLDSKLRERLSKMLGIELAMIEELPLFKQLAPIVSDYRAVRAFIKLVAGEAQVSNLQDGAESGQPPGSLLFCTNQFAYPGEHGFRFFPSFYRHVFDTMKRIPLTQPWIDKPFLENDLVEAYQEGGGYKRQGRSTVYDNLVAVQTVGYASDGTKPSLQLPRRQLRSMEEMRQLYQQFISRAGFTSADLKSLTRGFLKYATSSRLRREKEYEGLSWYDLLEGDRLSERGRFLMETTPGSLLALSGSQGDARSHGTIGLQCLSDQLTATEKSDSLLNGPTDTAWFGPWYRYLKTQEVEFYRGALRGFTLVNGSLEPMVELLAPHSCEVVGHARFEPTEKDRERSLYFIIALPLLEAQELAEGFCQQVTAMGKSATDFERLLRFPGETPQALRAGMGNAEGCGPLRHMSGIQYFFNHEMRLWQAHTQYFNAAAGVTAIAQPQFWLESRDLVSGYRSVLSVDICTWQIPQKNGRPVPGASHDPSQYGWGKDRDQLAHLVWEQIGQGHRVDFSQGNFIQPPRPFAYHIDDNLEFKPTLQYNHTPYLVNQTGRYRQRPGGRVAQDYHVQIEYDVVLDRYVLAGIYMQTWTRITAMEAACESGRHAVNAVLRHLGYRGEGCAIWDPEDYEPPDLAPLKELDEQLCQRGLPHMLDITR